MMRLIAAMALLASVLLADSAQDAEAVIWKAAAALRDGKAPALWLLFDPKMRGFGEIRQQSQTLVAGGDVLSTVEFTRDEGDDKSRTLELDWKMDITENQRVSSTTVRHQKVVCKLENQGGNWKIVSFEPAGFFGPTHAAQVWDVLSNAAIALNSTVEERPVNPSLFLSTFDSKMAGYPKLVEGITGLTRMGPVESSVEMIGNQGDDHVRTEEVDWLLQVMNKETGIVNFRKEQHLHFQMEWNGKRWRITSVDPLAFFSAAGSLP